MNICKDCGKKSQVNTEGLCGYCAKESVKASYRKLIIKKALLGYEANVWDMVESGRPDAEIEKYIAMYLPEYKDLLLAEGVNAVLEKLEDKDAPMKEELCKKKDPWKDRRPREDGEIIKLKPKMPWEVRIKGLPGN